jgi:hypothetical protein
MPLRHRLHGLRPARAEAILTVNLAALAVTAAALALAAAAIAAALANTVTTPWQPPGRRVSESGLFD